MVLKSYYRKYRPQNLNELDLASVRQRLISLVKSKKTPHAFLFAGPRGTGKTSAARVLAKVLNCQKKKKTTQRLAYEPCNHCEICQEITNGTALDLIEIDAASNRGIDDIRALREKIKLSPVKCRLKVYIIDEVHMLTTEAFNALLKTLEEPPAHALFILCTTQPEKLPETIISRCLRFNFPKAKHPEIFGCLERAVKGEKLKVEKGVLPAIAKAVDGSFRDAHKLLEQLALSGKKITLRQTKELLQQTEELGPRQLLMILADKNVLAALREIDRVVTGGGDLIIYVQQILDQLRLGMLAKIGLSEFSHPEEFEKLSLVQIEHLIGLFSEAYRELKFSPIPQLPLELVAVNFCGQENSSPEQKTIGNSRKKKQTISGNGDLGQVKSKWEAILAGVKPLNHSVQALMRACRPVNFDGQTLTVEVFYKFHKERLETEKCRQIVEQVSSEVLGNPVRLDCILGKKKIISRPSSSETEDIVTLAENIFNGKGASDV